MYLTLGENSFIPITPSQRAGRLVCVLCARLLRVVLLSPILLGPVGCRPDNGEPIVAPVAESAPSVGYARADSDRAALVEFYRATGGDGWKRKDGWLTDAPIDSWYGVGVSDGEVASIRLPDNNLKGRLPAVLGGLASLSIIDLSYNELWGGIPPEFGGLSELERLDLAVNRLSGPLPTELSKLLKLRHLSLISSGNTGPIPAWLGHLSQLRWLELGENRLYSRIPSELAKLRNLEILYLANSGLAGPLPPELGNLDRLRYLYLSRNHFAGSIPPEYGSMIALRAFYAWGSQITGEIPPELGNLANLQRLDLWSNRLTGTIPPELGNIEGLTELGLGRNALSGPIPRELGRLSELEKLRLRSNQLEGGLPPELGALSKLRTLTLGSNPGLSGSVPREWLELTLDELEAGAVDLCAPDDPEFRRWLNGIDEGSMQLCGSNTAPLDAYLVQATQNRADPVPLVAGREALLRAFVTAERSEGETFPAVRARFYLKDRLTFSLDIPGTPSPIPSEVEELDLTKSAKGVVPGWVVQPGLEMVIDVDPLGTVDSTVAMARRIPAEGRIPVRVETMPAFQLTVIPWISPIDDDESIVDLVRSLTAESAVFNDTRALLPVSDIDLTLHDPVRTSTRIGHTILDQTEALRVLEGGAGYYLSLTKGLADEVAGVAFLGGWSAYSAYNAGVIAHELGHNLSLAHAPCGVDGDPAFPYADGSVGTVGYDFLRRRTVPGRAKDFMSYCGPAWIADWSVRKMIRHRLRKEGPPARVAESAPVPALLLWGGSDEEGRPFLNPAFAVDAPVALPETGGPWEIVGRSQGGAVLFSLDFATHPTSNNEKRTGFAFAVPARPEWAETLAEITLRGPNGFATLSEETDRPSAILRDSATGQVRAILIDMPPAPAAEIAAGTAFSLMNLSVLRSRGLPGSWR
ncbi:MAG: hypothetical protein F4Z72_05455 [Gemmatimonadales bacterium]|nr:hypothetical protein [Candidatus Palauibacter irciniicola]